MCTQDKTSNNSESVKKNALIYLRYKDRFEDIDIKELTLFQQETEQAYKRLNLPIRGRYTEEQFIQMVNYNPYKNLEEMTKDVEDNNRILISTLNNDSQLLPGYLNLQFRAVHDYLHYLLQQPFDYTGEYKVYQAQKHVYKTKLRRQILYSEIVLQAAYCTYFGKFADKQKVILF
jgi:hypothetical protein